MFYRPCPDIEPPDETDLDDPAMAEAAVAVERGEQDLRVLSRLVEIGTELAEALRVYAKARLAAATVEGAAPLAPNEDPTAPFSKIAQTVRRTIALKGKLAEDVKTGRADLIGKRVARREKRDEVHYDAKITVIDGSVRQALSQDRPDLSDEAAERLLDDMREFLCDSDEFADILDRPVGEAVARLCELLGLDPGYCVPDGDGWKIRREPYAFEIARTANTLHPSPSWGGTGREASRVGNVDASTDPAGFPPLPHPDGFAVCPSP